jgi:hypothetical protein
LEGLIRGLRIGRRFAQAPALRLSAMLRRSVARAVVRQLADRGGIPLLIRFTDCNSYLSCSRSVLEFKHDNHACQFGFMWFQTGETGIAPVGKAHNFAGSRFHFRRSGGLQNLETAAIEKECMIPEQIVQLTDRWMIIGENLGIELAQGLFHLCRI